ncbi:MAG: response regulator, partial [Chloroflexi bacterium]
QDYNAAVIDLALPGMNGFDLIRRIRQHQRYANLPCIAYTAYHSSKVRYEAKESGFDAYLEKPLDRKLLITTLKELID